MPRGFKILPLHVRMIVTAVEQVEKDLLSANGHPQIVHINETFVFSGKFLKKR